MKHYGSYWARFSECDENYLVRCSCTAWGATRTVRWEKKLLCKEFVHLLQADSCKTLRSGGKNTVWWIIQHRRQATLRHIRWFYDEKGADIWRNWGVWSEVSFFFKRHYIRQLQQNGRTTNAAGMRIIKLPTTEDDVNSTVSLLNDDDFLYLVMMDKSCSNGPRIWNSIHFMSRQRCKRRVNQFNWIWSKCCRRHLHYLDDGQSARNRWVFTSVHDLVLLPQVS